MEGEKGGQISRGDFRTPHRLCKYLSEDWCVVKCDGYFELYIATWSESFKFCYRLIIKVCTFEKQYLGFLKFVVCYSAV